MWRVICTELGWTYRKLDNQGNTTSTQAACGGEPMSEDDAADSFCGSDSDDTAEDEDFCWFAVAAEDEDDYY